MFSGGFHFSNRIIAGFSGLRISQRTIATNEPLRFQLTANLYAEPLKKKKKLDPAIIRAREEKRKRRIEKMIRRLEKGSRQLKPLEECAVPLEIVDQKQQRERPHSALSAEVLNERISVGKAWTAYKHRQWLKDIQMIDRIMQSQQWALDELKNEDLELYNAAIQTDESLIPFMSKGPVETPPIVNYDSPDGEYVDISKKWDS